MYIRTRMGQIRQTMIPRPATGYASEQLRLSRCIQTLLYIVGGKTVAKVGR
jgi:hypothetical protein